MTDPSGNISSYLIYLQDRDWNKIYIPAFVVTTVTGKFTIKNNRALWLSVHSLFVRVSIFITKVQAE